MFPNTQSKLEDTRIALEQMKNAQDSINFKFAFSAFLTSARSITYVLQKEYNNVEGFKEWYEIKQREMQEDRLLRFIHEARTEDFHEGKHRLSFQTYINYLNTSDLGQPPEPNASLGIGAEGPFWILDAGTPGEHRIPIKQNINSITSVSIENPPNSHLGQPLTMVDPITICSLALEYILTGIEPEYAWL
jgi:hypothetical protein